MLRENQLIAILIHESSLLQSMVPLYNSDDNAQNIHLKCVLILSSKKTTENAYF